MVDVFGNSEYFNGEDDSVDRDLIRKYLADNTGANENDADVNNMTELILAVKELIVDLIKTHEALLADPNNKKLRIEYANKIKITQQDLAPMALQMVISAGIAGLAYQKHHMEKGD